MTLSMEPGGLLRQGDPSAPWTIILAHGAGAAMDSPFMNDFSDRLLSLRPDGIGVVRFEFPYMEERRRSGRRRPPNSIAQLKSSYGARIEAVSTGMTADQRLIIGGKSMGGRVASMIADEYEVSGLVCLGYPFHPPGKPDRLRTKHLETLTTPCLMCQGSRDALGDRAEVADYVLSDSIRFHWLEDGDHGFKPRKRSGHTLEGHLDLAAQAMVDFIDSL